MLQQTMTVDEAAGYLHVTPRTVRDWISDGKLKAKRVGRRYIINAETLSAMLGINSETEDIKITPERRAYTREMLKLLAGADKGPGTEIVMAARRKDKERLKNLSSVKDR